MQYPANRATLLINEHKDVNQQLELLFLEVHISATKLTSVRAKEYLQQGVGRRLMTLRRSLWNIFELFPPDRKKPLLNNNLEDIQINLHGFVINLYGIFENLAWSFILHHDLEERVGGRKNVSLFHSSTQKLLPVQLSSYLKSSNILNWQVEYLKNYRDSLAHRIPLYVPPAAFTHEEGIHFNLLEEEKVECIKMHQFSRVDEIHIEQENIGRASPVFLRLLSDTVDTELPIYLHPQLLCDAKTVLEFSSLFFKHWLSKA